MKRLLLICHLTIVSFIVCSQEALSPDVTVVPPSPEVVAMNKFTELPVSYYTGLPQISIPIYTLSTGKIHVPVSLEYNASGLRVSEYASNVGAGWSLSGGGVISRTIRGLTDERQEGFEKGFFYGTNWLNANGTINITVFEDCSQVADFTGPEPTQEYYVPVNPPDYLTAGLWDSEPDRFNYSYPGGGGKFLFTHTRNPVLLSPADISIVHPFTSLSGNMHETGYYWSIDGSDGTKYIYSGKAEWTTSESPCATTLGSEGIPMPPYDVSEDQTSWFLTRIENGEEWIDYSYINANIKDSVKISESLKYKLGGLDGETSLTECQSTRTRQTWLMKSITSSNGYKVDFIYGNTRADLEGSPLLSRVDIKYQNITVKSFDLLNDTYFGNNSKLKLSGVDVLDKDLNKIYGYDLTYYSGSFPDHDTRQQDYWGFYNGATGNLTSSIGEWLDDKYHVYHNSTVDRNPSLAHTQIGTLKQITYPTGGSAEFEYELNDFSGTNTIEYLSYEIEADGDEFNTDYNSLIFTVVDPSPISMLYDSIPDGLDAFAGLEKLNTQSGIYEPYTPQEKVGYAYFATAARRDIEPGTYKLWAESSGSPIALEINFEQKGHLQFQKAGGLRIKKITHLNQAEKTHTIFKYTLDSTLASSGKLFNNPANDGYYSTYEGGNPVNGACNPSPEEDFGHFINLSSNVQVPLTTVNGSHIGYSMVRALKVSDQELQSYTAPITVQYHPEYASFSDLVGNGIEVFQYINDYTGLEAKNDAYPYILSPDLDYKNGQLLKQLTYEIDSAWDSQFNKYINTKVLQRQLLNEYDTLIITSLKSFLFKRTVSSYCYNCSEGKYLSDNSYIDYARMLRLRKSFDTTIEDGRQLEKITLFDFDHPNHLEIAAQSTLLSNGDTLRTEYSRNAAKPKFIERSDTYRDGQLISSDSLEYLDNLPYKYFKRNTQTGIHELKKVYDYNPNGKVEYVISNPSGTTSTSQSTYLYSYDDGSIVVAEIMNADTLLVDQKLSQINSVYNRLWLSTQTDTNLINQVLDSLRSLLDSSTPITSYQYTDGIIAFGPTGVTDPNGLTSTYEYDSFGRLYKVLDHEGNVLKRIEYNYKNN